MESRFLLTRRGCHFCNQAIKVINFLNLKLPLDKQIKIIDCVDWEEFGVKSIPLMDILNKIGLEKGYPFLYISGIIIEPALTPQHLKIMLSSMLQEEFIY